MTMSFWCSHAISASAGNIEIYTKQAANHTAPHENINNSLNCFSLCDYDCLDTMRFHQFLTLVSCLFTAWSCSSSHLPVCGGHMFGRRRSPGSQGVSPDVSQSAAPQRSCGPHHIWPHGSSSWAELRGDCQELCVPRHQGSYRQTDTGKSSQRPLVVWCEWHTY